MESLEKQVKILLSSYSLEYLLEEHDLTEEFVLELLVELGHLDIEEYFDEC